jgi:hypothetical protein
VPVFNTCVHCIILKDASPDLSRTLSLETLVPVAGVLPTIAIPAGQNGLTTRKMDGSPRRNASGGNKAA